MDEALLPPDAAPSNEAETAVHPLDALLHTLSRIRKPFPAGAMREARARRGEITSYLLDALQNIVRRPVWDENNTLWFYGLYLLAEFREKAAAAPLIALCRQPIQIIDELLGDDAATEELPMLLYAVAAHVPGELMDLVRDSTVDAWIRDAAVDVLRAMVERGDIPAETVRDFAVTFMRRVATEERPAEERPKNLMKYKGWNKAWDEDMIATFVALLCADLHFTDTLPDIEALAHVDRLDETIVDLDSLQKDLAPDRVPPSAEEEARRRNHDRVRPVDAVKELENWGCFSDEPDGEYTALTERQRARVEEELVREAHGYAPTPAPIVGGRKTGPNEPCPCGSGRKFKRCCGR